MSYDSDARYDYRPLDKWERLDAKMDSLKRQLAECPAWDSESIESLQVKIARFGSEIERLEKRPSEHQ